MSTEALFSRLDHVRQIREDQWRARCPAHDGKSDDSPSIALRRDGALLLHCFAGCSVQTVVDAIGLKGSDLFPPRQVTVADIQVARDQRQRRDMERALAHELHVLLQLLQTRIAAQTLATDTKFRVIRPEWMPFPEDRWERERLAVRRIRNGIRWLYG